MGPASAAEAEKELRQQQDCRRVHHAFGCGVHFSEFWDRFKRQSGKKQQTFVRVAQRAWCAGTLRYHLHGRVWFDEWIDWWNFDRIELPSLEVHLLFTCLDVLAGGAFQSFAEWIDSPSVRREFELATRCLDYAELKQLANKYQEEHGVTVNLRKLFENLPAPVHSWLANQFTLYAVPKPSADMNQLTEEDLFGPGGVWRALAASFGAEKVVDPQKMMQQLAHHYYQRRRNDYTHRGLTVSILMSDDITVQATSGSMHGWPPGEGFGALQAGKIKEDIVIREGMDEGTILRLILYAVVLDRMKIRVTPERVQTYVTGCSRQCAAYRFLHEVEENHAVLEQWATDAQLNSWQSSVNVTSGFPPLHTLWADRLVSRLDPSLTEFERTLGQFIEGYARTVRSLNVQVEEFNAHNPTRGSDQGSRGTAVRDFAAALIQTDLYRHVMDTMTDRLVITHASRIAENPWYNA